MTTKPSRLDSAYRRLLLSRLFTKGWGSHEQLISLRELRQRFSYREPNLIPDDHPVTIVGRQQRREYEIIEGRFESPLHGLLPQKARIAHFQVLIPHDWPFPSHRPVCLHLAGTGDQRFWRRRHLMARPLLKYGIAGIILESPFYGLRKPDHQVRSQLQHVVDILTMGACVMIESAVLLRWCQRYLDLGPIGVTGVSMGGHLASLAACAWPGPGPCVLVPCLSWSTASSVFTEGVMSESVDWDKLQQQCKEEPKFYTQLEELCKVVDPFVMSRIDIGMHPEEPVMTAEPELWRRMKWKRLSGRRCDWQRHGDAVRLMRGLMDECTHLVHFPPPIDKDLVIAVCARRDGYVPMKGVSGLQDIWPGITVRYVDSGHIAACLWHRKLFQDAIVEAFDRARKKRVSNNY